MKVVWHCEDVVGARMAGPGNPRRRAGAAAGAAAPGRAGRGRRRRALRRALSRLRDLAAALKGAEVFVAQGFGFPLQHLLRFRGRVVLDLYDPVQLEQLARMGAAPTAEEIVQVGYVWRRLQYLIRRADHVLCASRAQRAHWLGWLGACGRLSPQALADDPEVFQVARGGPVRASGTAAGTPWLTAPGSDSALAPRTWSRSGPEASGTGWIPALAVRAVALARRRVPRLNLALIAGRRPGTAAPQMHLAADEAREVAGAGVHFIETWIPYEERGAWLLDADLSVSAHKPSLEAELAFRTRLLDCLWAALPAACTAGDVLASEGEHQGWARTAPPLDVDRFADALVALCDPGENQRARSSARTAAQSRTWQHSADTLPLPPLSPSSTPPPPPRPPNPRPRRRLRPQSLPQTPPLTRERLGEMERPGDTILISACQLSGAAGAPRPAAELAKKLRMVVPRSHVPGLEGGAEGADQGGGGVDALFVMGGHQSGADDDAVGLAFQGGG